MSDDAKELLFKIGAALLTAAILVGLIYGIVACLSYRKTITIEVKDRQWEYWAAIKWDTQETRIVTDENCTGTGNNRKCTTSFHTEHYTVAHTRCENTSYGTELPPTAPVLGCTMLYGDYRRENVRYLVTFQEAGKAESDRRTIDLAWWDRMKPGARRDVQVDIVGNIRDFAKE